MSFYAITGLVNAVTATFLGFFVYLKNRKEIANRTFARFCIAVVVWSYSYFLWQISTTSEMALFWSRALMMGSIFIPVTLFHFGITFLDILQKERKILIAGYLLTFLFFISNFTPFFVNRVEPTFSFNFWPKPGIFFHFFHLMFIGYVVYFWYLLIKAYRKSEGIWKLQIGYVLTGSLIGFIAGETNHFLWYNIPTPPIWNFIPALGFLLIAYGVVKHRLLNIRVILTETLVIATGLTLLVWAVMAEPFVLKILGGALFVFFTIFGYQLVRSVIKEIELRGELEKAYAELERIDRAKTEFLSMASHQLRTPLGIIKGYISMMLEGDFGEISEKAQEKLRNAYVSNDRLVKLVNDLLDVTRLEMGRIELNLEKASIEEIISSVVEEMKGTAEKKGLYLKWAKPATALPEMSLDKNKIRQVILNLIDNAIKYTNQGGITLKTQITNSKLQITVIDTGVGMEKEEIDKLFEVMARGKAGLQYWMQGAGLGLYTARKFVEMHGGKVWAESPGKDKGSTFYVELPIK
jgi:signal transduction histidine kinase